MGIAAARVKRCIEFIESGLTAAEVYRTMCSPERPEGQRWDCTERTVENYFTRARRIIEAETVEAARYYLNLNLRRLNHLYGKALSVADHSTCNQIIRTQNKMLNMETATSESELNKVDLIINSINTEVRNSGNDVN